MLKRHKYKYYKTYVFQSDYCTRTVEHKLLAKTMRYMSECVSLKALESR